MVMKGSTRGRGMASESAAKRPTRYIVTDGELVLELELDDEVGGYTVTSPFNPGLVTEAETLEGAFEMARDALEALSAARRGRDGDQRA
jgi:antitoxin HicB